VRTTASRSLSERRDRRGSGELRFTDIGFESDGTSIDSPVTGRPLDIVLTYECAERPPREVEFALSVVTHLGETMLYLSSSLVGTQMSGIPAAGRVRCHIPRCPLPAGQYLVHAISENQRAPIDYVERACEMTVMQGDFFGTGQAPHSRHRAVMVQHQWDLEPIEEAPAPVEAEPVPGRAP